MLVSGKCLEQLPERVDWGVPSFGGGRRRLGFRRGALSFADDIAHLHQCLPCFQVVGWDEADWCPDEGLHCDEVVEERAVLYVVEQFAVRLQQLPGP